MCCPSAISNLSVVEFKRDSKKFAAIVVIVIVVHGFVKGCISCACHEFRCFGIVIESVGIDGGQFFLGELNLGKRFLNNPLA